MNAFRLAFAAIFVAGAAAFCQLSAQEEKGSATETILGSVVAVAWDENDEVTAVAIEVVREIESEGEEDEPETYIEDHYVVDNEKGRELLALVGGYVEATGIVEINEDADKFITVIEYTVIDEVPEDN